MLWYLMQPKPKKKTPLRCTPAPYFLMQAKHYGHVRLLLLRLSSPVWARSSPLTFFGSFALAQHCMATLLMRSISSRSSLNCLLASLLFLSFTPFSSLLVAVYCSPGAVKLRLPAKAVRSALGEETRDSRSPHSTIKAWMPADNCVARERRYGHWSGPQKGSDARASRRAGRM